MNTDFTSNLLRSTASLYPNPCDPPPLENLVVADEVFEVFEGCRSASWFYMLYTQEFSKD